MIHECIKWHKHHPILCSLRINIEIEPYDKNGIDIATIQMPSIDVSNMHPILSLINTVVCI